MRRLHHAAAVILRNWNFGRRPSIRAEYFDVGTCVLPEVDKDKADPMKLYHTCDQDIVYEGLCIDVVLSFMAATKNKHQEGNSIYSS